MTDTENSDTLYNRSLDNTSVFIAVIKEVIPHLNAYLITAPSAGSESLYACRGDTGAGFIFQGAQSITTLSIGTTVVVVLAPGMERTGIIIATIPSQITSDLNLTRSLVTRSRVGFVHDPAFRTVFENESADESMVPDFSAGTPLDALPGDWGYINEAGIHVMIGRLRAVMGTAEMNRLEFFGLDDLARLSAWNWEHRGPAIDHRIIDDGGEYNEIRLMSPTTWEGLGSPTPSGAYEVTDGEILQDQLDAYREPTESDQQGIFRHQLFRGFLGNGEKEYIATLSPTASDGILRYSDTSRYVGLLSISKGLDGAYSLKSAKEITLEKTIVIPVPKEMILPEDELGDNPTNYKAAGVLESEDGEPHNLREYGDGDLSPDEKIAALYDYGAYVNNHYNISPFVEHTKDWHISEEDYGDNSVKDNWGGIATAIFKPGVISSTQFLYPKPSSQVLTIDQREDHSVRYYVSKSIFKQLDDGSILVEDGYGSQIKMTGGSIFMTCPGDIIRLPGRNDITWAPNDAIIRAGSSVDITAAHHDVRIKAEKNLHVLGGNSGSGGILIESRGAGTIEGSQFEKLGEKAQAPGIIFKSEESDIYLLAKNKIFSGITSESGTIVNDAKAGAIYNVAANLVNDLAVNYVTQIDKDSSDPASFFFGAKGGIMTSALVTDTLILASESNSALAVKGSIFVEGDVAALGGVIAGGSVAAEGGVAFGPVEGIKDQLQDVVDTVNDIARDADDAELAVSDVVSTLDSLLISSEESPANLDVIMQIGFSCRTNDDYAIPDDFVLFESRWQQLYRTDITGDKWDEPVVTGPTGEETLPHPGIKAWQEDEETYATIGLSNIDTDTGFAKDRETIKADKPEITKTGLKDNYLISHQKR